MSIYDLFGILQKLEKRQESDPIMISEDSSDDGLIEEEERARDDEYEETLRTDLSSIPVQHITRTVTRRRARRSRTPLPVPFVAIPNKPGGQKKKKKRGMLCRRVSKLSETHDSESHTDIENTEKLLFQEDSLLLKTPPFLKGESVRPFAKQLLDRINQRWPVQLPGIFQKHAESVLPTEKKQHLPSLVQLYRQLVIQTEIPTILSDIETDIASYAAEKTEVNILFANIFRNLVFSSCSEASVERIFSLLRCMCGKRRYNLKVASLRAALYGRSRRISRLKRLK